VVADGDRHWFEDLAEHMGPAYLRYSFTKGTTSEVDFLMSVLNLHPGERLLDVGCGPGRHVLEFARRGIHVVGVDISERFVDVGTEMARRAGLDERIRFLRADARSLHSDAATGSSPLDPLPEAPFDAAISLCQGAFGLGGPSAAEDPQNLAADEGVLAGMNSLLRPGGRLAVSAFSSYFQVRWLESGDVFDAASGINVESTEVRDPQGRLAAASLWTTCYTPRELRLIAERVGIVVDAVHSVAPGAYAAAEPTTDSQEFLLLGHRSADSGAFSPDQGFG